jgi:hypothetical protein
MKLKVNLFDPETASELPPRCFLFSDSIKNNIKFKETPLMGG